MCTNLQSAGNDASRPLHLVTCMPNVHLTLYIPKLDDGISLVGTQLTRRSKQQPESWHEDSAKTTKWLYCRDPNSMGGPEDIIIIGTPLRCCKNKCASLLDSLITIIIVITTVMEQGFGCVLSRSSTLPNTSDGGRCDGKVPAECWIVGVQGLVHFGGTADHGYASGALAYDYYSTHFVGFFQCEVCVLHSEELSAFLGTISSVAPVLWSTW